MADIDPIAPKAASNSLFSELESLAFYFSYLKGGLASAFRFTEAARKREAERMLSTYGPSLPQQARFLETYLDNLELFGSSGLNADSFERADLLAREAAVRDGIRREEVDQGLEFNRRQCDGRQRHHHQNQQDQADAQRHQIRRQPLACRIPSVC